MTTKRKSVPRSVADVTQGLILASVEIEAPPARVFQALTSSEVTQWWGSADTYRTTEWAGDVRPGGKWRANGVGNDGHRFSVGGEFLELDPPNKIVQTWIAEWDGNHTTTLTYRLEAIDGGTRVTIRHEGFGDRVESCRGHSEGWERVLQWLAGFAGAAPAASPMRHFMCRLIPPRPTFAMDMNAEERAMMMTHVTYWRNLLAQGTAIVFGPVGDPKGPFGLGVIRAKDEEELNGYRDGDPAIQSGLGFRYEVIPMLNAVYRE